MGEGPYSFFQQYPVVGGLVGATPVGNRFMSTLDSIDQTRRRQQLSMQYDQQLAKQQKEEEQLTQLARLVLSSPEDIMSHQLSFRPVSPAVYKLYGGLKEQAKKELGHKRLGEFVNRDIIEQAGMPTIEPSGEFPRRSPIERGGEIQTSIPLGPVRPFLPISHEELNEPRQLYGDITEGPPMPHPTAFTPTQPQSVIPPGAPPSPPDLQAAPGEREFEMTEAPGQLGRPEVSRKPTGEDIARYVMGDVYMADAARPFVGNIPTREKVTTITDAEKVRLLRAAITKRVLDEGLDPRSAQGLKRRGELEDIVGFKPEMPTGNQGWISGVAALEQQGVDPKTPEGAAAYRALAIRTNNSEMLRAMMTMEGVPEARIKLVEEAQDSVDRIIAKLPDEVRENAGVQAALSAFQTQVATASSEPKYRVQNLGRAQMQIGQAAETARKSIVFERQFGQRLEIAQAHLDRAETATTNNQYDSAMREIDRAIGRYQSLLEDATMGRLGTFGRESRDSISMLLQIAMLKKQQLERRGRGGAGGGTPVPMPPGTPTPTSKLNIDIPD